MWLKNRFYFFSILVLPALMNGCGYQDMKRTQAEAFAKFGTAYNLIRQQHGLPLLPEDNWQKSGWQNWNVSFLSQQLAVCDFSHYGTTDTIARWAWKDVYFYTADQRAIREKDGYCSGRKYPSKDGETEEWERLEISYAYLSDSLPHIRELQDEPKMMKKGSRQARLFVPKPYLITIGESKEKITVLHLESRPISMAQADSVLSRWGLSRNQK